MKTLSRLAALSLILAAASQAAVAAGSSEMSGPAGSADAGKSKSTICQACHGVDGNSINPEWPSLAGQHDSYIRAQLKHFRSGDRQNVLMTSQATNLSDQDIADLAAYYSALPKKTPGANPAVAEAGERIYRGGNPDSGVSACSACHGPAGAGNPNAAIPELAGQHATYTANTLRQYASGERDGGLNNMMSGVAARMTDDEIKAVAGYIQGLR